MRKTLASLLCIVFLVSMMFTVSFNVSADGITTYAPSFWDNASGKWMTGVPSGWSGSAMEIGSWGQITNINKTTGMLIYDNQIWENVLEYSVTVGNYGWENTQRANVIFYYQNALNYYYLSMGGSTNGSLNTIELGKKVNGVDSNISTYDGSLKIDGHTIKIVVDNSNNISVTATKSGTTTVLFSDIRDTTFSSGKIGVGTVIGSAVQCDFSAFNVKSMVNVPETIGVYEENFDNADTATLNWKNYRTKTMTISGGMVKSDWADDRIFILDNKTLTKNYVYSLDTKVEGSDIGNEVRIPFNYSNPGTGDKFYFVKLQGGLAAKNPTIGLYKCSGGADTLLKTYGDDDGTADVFVTADAKVRVEIIYEIGGYITVNITKGGIKTTIFDRFYDTSYGPGKIGVGTRGSGATFDNVKIEEESAQVLQKYIMNFNSEPVTSLAAEKGNDIFVVANVKNNLVYNNLDGVFTVILKDDKGIVKAVSLKNFTVLKNTVGSEATMVLAKITVPSDVTDTCKIEGYFWSKTPYMQPYCVKKAFN